jgi:uracil-DNA glycosylase
VTFPEQAQAPLQLEPPQPPAIGALIDALAHTPVAADAFNPYAAGGPPATAVRRANLALALAQILAHGPSLVLVAEAPGYRGCRRTGVPFTSDPLLLDGIDPPGLFGSARGFRHASDDGRTPAEQTATIIWRELRRHRIVALGWNAWPFHPHRAGNPESNRPPRAAELRQGLPFLQAALALAPAVPVVALGNCAHRSLATLGAPHHRLRHPAQGGATLFANGLAAIVGALYEGRSVLVQ